MPKHFLTRILSSVALLAATILVAGCMDKADKSEEPQTAPQPASVVFSGKADPKFAGAWKTKDGRSALTLNKDGSLKILAVFAGPKGDTNSTISGKWLVSEPLDPNLHSKGSLLLKYSTPGQPETTLQYTTVLSGNILTLTQGRIKTVYLRK